MRQQQGYTGTFWPRLFCLLTETPRPCNLRPAAVEIQRCEALAVSPCGRSVGPHRRESSPSWLQHNFPKVIVVQGFGLEYRERLPPGEDRERTEPRKLTAHAPLRQQHACMHVWPPDRNYLAIEAPPKAEPATTVELQRCYSLHTYCCRPRRDFVIELHNVTFRKVFFGGGWSM